VQDKYLKIMHHLFKLFPVYKDKGLGFSWQWNSYSCLQGYESVWCVSWVLCASKFKVGNIGSMFMVCRKLIIWIFIAVRATDIGEDVHYGLWDFDTVQPGKWLPVLWRNMLPPSAEGMNILLEKNLIPVALWHILTWAVMWHFLITCSC